MRKFKVECLFDSFGGEDTHWQEVEAENADSSDLLANDWVKL